jgi:hypothetical protein
VAKTSDQLNKARLALLAKIAVSTFKWYDVSLEYKSKSGVTASLTVQVCNPVRIDGFYVPVSAKETFALARRFGWLPLTRAVADQAHNQAKQFSFIWNSQLFDFETYSKKVGKLYDPVYDASLISGSHKLWLLSTCKPKATNYGFYLKHKPDLKRSPRLKGEWWVAQSEGGEHNELWWDYSQLLQLMKSDSLMIDGATYTLSDAVVAGLEAVWDESSKLTQADLPV